MLIFNSYSSYSSFVQSHSIKNSLILKRNTHGTALLEAGLTASKQISPVIRHGFTVAMLPRFNLRMQGNILLRSTTDSNVTPVQSHYITEINKGIASFKGKTLLDPMKSTLYDQAKSTFRNFDSNSHSMYQTQTLLLHNSKDSTASYIEEVLTSLDMVRTLEETGFQIVFCQKKLDGDVINLTSSNSVPDISIGFRPVIYPNNFLGILTPSQAYEIKRYLDMDKKIKQDPNYEAMGGQIILPHSSLEQPMSPKTLYDYYNLNAAWKLKQIDDSLVVAVEGLLTIDPQVQQIMGSTAPLHKKLDLLSVSLIQYHSKYVTTKDLVPHMTMPLIRGALQQTPIAENIYTTLSESGELQNIDEIVIQKIMSLPESVRLQIEQKLPLYLDNTPKFISHLKELMNQYNIL